MYRVAVLLASVLMAAAMADSPPNAPQLAEALLANHSWMFSAEEAATLDRAHRMFRQANAAEHPPPGQPRPPLPEGETPASYREKAWELLRSMLDGNEHLRTLDLTAPEPALVPAGVMEMPGEVGAFLCRIVRGNAGELCVPVDFSMIQREMAGPLRVDALPDGTTYFLASMRGLATGLSYHNFMVTSKDKPPVTLPISWRTPKPGRLVLRVLSHDTGEPAPAMVRLQRMLDGRVYPPSNALDLATRFESQGHATSTRAALLPGALGGEYQCMPGPIDMMLPPGAWRVTVRRGVEHVPEVRDIRIEEGHTASLELRPVRWVNMPARGWYSGDDHVHFRIMSDTDAATLLAWMQAEDVHLTNVVRMGDISRTYFDQRGWGPAFRVRAGNHVLSPGQECPRTHNEMGHTLAMNTRNMVRDTDQYYLYDLHFDKIHAQGGLAGYAHVNSNLFHVERDMTLNVPRGKVDFAEIFQFNFLGLEYYYQFLNMGFALTAACGSDVPWGGTAGEERVYAYTGDDTLDPDAWFEALKAGRTFVTNGPMLEFTVNGAMPGSVITVAPGDPVKIMARALGGGRFTPTKLEVVANGEVRGTAETGGDTIEIELDLDPGHGCWVAARAEGSDGSKAHTTPVYVRREGLRWWKYDALPDLFKERRRCLDEIAEIVKQAQDADARGTVETDRALKQLSLQGAALLQRVEQARAYYDGLEQTMQDEAAPRGVSQ